MKDVCLIYGMPVMEFPFGYDEDDELCLEIKAQIRKNVADLIKKGVKCFITDCEYGVPLWGAEIVLAKKKKNPEVELLVFMPHEEQAVKWTPNWRKRYFYTHMKSDKVVIYNDYEKCAEVLFSSANNVIYVGTDSPDFLEKVTEKGGNVIKFMPSLY